MNTNVHRLIAVKVDKIDGQTLVVLNIEGGVVGNFGHIVDVLGFNDIGRPYEKLCQQIGEAVIAIGADEPLP